MEGTEPIYNGSTATRGGVLLLMLSFLLRHQLTGLAMRDLIDMLNAIVPGCLPKSKYYIDKLLNVSYGIICHIYCHVCLSYIGVYENNQIESICAECSNINKYDSNIKTGNFFIMLPLESQLRDLLEKPEIQSVLYLNRGSDDGVFRDVCDGHNYKKHSELGSDTHNISTVWNTDGVPVFESSNYSIWPVYHMINELPYDIRSRNTVLHALCFGNKKPRMETFFKPFVDDGINMFNKGFEWQQICGTRILSKVLFLVCSCDSVARAPLQNIKQFNGKYGCSFCLHEGVTAAKGNGHTRVYPCTEEPPELRTHESMVDHAEEAIISGMPVKGVKGPNILMLLPKFDVAESFVPDYMHAVLLGVVRAFVYLWLDSSSFKCDYYLGGVKDKIDTALLKINPPAEIRRLPRSLDSRKYWKASEWRNFLLFYSPVILHKLLPSKYYDHWLLLVFAVSTLLSCPSYKQITQADLALNKFVVLVREFYGLEYVSFNVHLLTHLSNAVLRWGPLWANSNFVFEDTNRMLLKLFHGTQAAPMQICKTFMTLRLVKRIYETHAPSIPESCCTDILDRCFNTGKSVRNALIFIDSVCLGTSTCSNLTVQEIFAIETVTQTKLPHILVKSFQRAVFQRMILTTETYSAKFGRNDSFVILNNNIIGVIVKICVFTCYGDECICPSEPMLVILKYETEARWKKIDTYVDANLFVFVHKVFRTNNLFACNLDQVRKKLLHVPNVNGDGLSVIEPPNCILE